MPIRLTQTRATVVLLGLALAVLGSLAGAIAASGQEPKELEGILVPRPKPTDFVELAGLPPGTRPEVLTLERAYTLALVKARTPKQRLAEKLDPKALDDQAARAGTADFARFREEFLRSEEPAAGAPAVHFRDPAESMLGVLAPLMAVESAREHMQALESFIAVARELLAAEGEDEVRRGLQRPTAKLEEARRAFAAARRDYRDGLDTIKLELGLSPHAPVIADSERLAPFRRVFDAIETWQRDPRRNEADVPRIVHRLAPLDGGALDFLAGRPTLAALAADPAKLEPALLAAESLAIKNRGGNDPDGTIGYQVRRRLRHLVETHSAYETARRELVALILWKDDAFEKMIAPPAAPNAPSSADAVRSSDVIALDAAFHKGESRLVSLWAAFHTERMALARAVRLMPARDWASFYASFAVPLADPPPPPSK